MRKILVGYDGSDGGRRALDRAIAEAQSSHSRIFVLSVVNMPLNPDVPRNYGTLDDISTDEGAPLSAPPDVGSHLSEAREELSRAGLQGELAWGAGPPADVIVDTARRVGADVIVVGEHHHGFLAGIFGADVGAGIQRAANCDVILA